jgi:hypothetical protein
MTPQNEVSSKVILTRKTRKFHRDGLPKFVRKSDLSGDDDVDRQSGLLKEVGVGVGVPLAVPFN